MSPNSSKTLSSLSGKVFISHAYNNPKEAEQLISMLPSQVEPFKFPREEPDPTKAVSGGIIEKILDCSALIYPIDALQYSKWVYFERDYALRSQIPVYSFNAEKRMFTLVNDEPVSLNFFLIVGEEGYDRASKIIDEMESRRHFKLNKEIVKIRRLKDVPYLASDILYEGIPIIWLLDDYLRSVVNYVFDEEQMNYFGLP